RQMRQQSRDVSKMADANRHHNPSSLEARSILHLQVETVRGALDICHSSRIQIRNQLLLNGKIVVDKGLQWNRDEGVVIGESTRLAKFLQREIVVGVRKVGREAIRLQQHSLRHVLPPHFHGAPEYCERYPA